MKLAVLMLAVSTACFAQDGLKTDLGSHFLGITKPNPDAPKNAHEFAVAKIAEFKKYQDDKNARSKSEFMVTSGMPTVMFSGFFAGNIETHDTQSFKASDDGTMILKNITAEDALLLMYAEEVDRNLQMLKHLDADQEQREEALKSIPPDSVKLHGKKYSVHNIPQWSNGVYGDTNCNVNRIRLLEDNPGKKMTMLHELMHVATNCDGSKTVHDAIYQIAPELLRILQENPDVVKYLTEPGVVHKKTDAWFAGEVPYSRPIPGTVPKP